MKHFSGVKCTCKETHRSQVYHVMSFDFLYFFSLHTEQLSLWDARPVGFHTRVGPPHPRSSISPQPRSPGSHCSLSSRGCAFSRTSCEWSHTWVWILSLSKTSLRLTRALSESIAGSLVPLNRSPFHGIPRSFRSLFEDHLGCFQLLTVMRRAVKVARRLYVDVCFQVLWVNPKEHDC